MISLVLPFPEARHVVELHARSLHPCGSEEMSLLDSRERVLAETIPADRDFPPFPRATRDGYAVHATDVSTVPVSLLLTGEAKAGAAPDPRASSLAHGACIEIMTGAPLPPGADAVVMVEYAERNGDTVTIRRTVRQGENFVPQGAEAGAGDALLRPGIRMSHAAIAVAASTGHARVSVYCRPKVAILATGDELVDIASQPGPAQIRNSNSWSLAAQVAAAGGEPLVLPVAADSQDSLRDLIERGLQADLLLLAGGVSAGKYDLVEQVLAGMGAEFFFTGALIQPGRPVVFGRIPAKDRLFYGLPGNPASTMVTFELFVRPAIDALCGAAPRPLAFVQARLKSAIHTKTGLTRFLPAILTGEFEQSEVDVVGWHGSGDVAAMARANCYVVVPPERDSIAAGEMVSIVPGEF